MGQPESAEKQGENKAAIIYSVANPSPYAAAGHALCQGRVIYSYWHWGAFKYKPPRANQFSDKIPAHS